ncbi:putative selenate reductase subunit YgfK [Megasphaera elsdenii]|uniref:putative selenate reductase subunit YgfK n=1 Tax=Megasphaera elsdenii TaxID=907 RepID=UPI000512C208|nr:putative selenate reductase subunit YgfK [Megasphaera elsdenii]KGI89839.1 gltD [Megasphaera elsdenii]MDY4264664.1 putative selenate reductase subunit YgfK [Megasphaera elsdenii]
MSDRMTSIPFGKLMNWVLTEAPTGTIFGVHHHVQADPERTYHIFDRPLEMPFGPAAGPHTQLAQNIVAGYVAGARFFELKTVQKIDGEDLPVPKPCIKADDECYNVEWSTELTVPKALEEYIKAWFLVHVMAVEYGLGSPDGMQFNMSVGYDLAGIQTAKIDSFIENLKDASHTAAFADCKVWLLAHLDRFQKLRREDVEAIPAAICNSVTVSTMHGCPPDEIERIARYLLKEKHLNTFVKCNPTLLGYDFVRHCMDDLGYGHMVFDDSHFKADLQYEDAVPMLKRLQEAGRAEGLVFGVKLTNTFPVDITRHELPGTEMYMSGKPLFFLAMNVAKKLSEAFGGTLPISYSGGADAHNIGDIVQTGIWPVTVATTLLKPGGYERFAQLAQCFEEKMGQSFTRVNVDALDALLTKAKGDAHYARLDPKAQQRKNDQALPMMDCFMAPCSQTCPIHQDIPAYMDLVAAGKYDQALQIILEKNPLPFTTGTVCYHTCMNSCTRNFCDDPVEIRRNKLIAAEKGYADVMTALQAAPSNGKKAAVIGAGPAGLSAAYFLARGGFDVTVFDKNDEPGGLVRTFLCEKKGQISPEAIDRDVALIEKMGVHLVVGKAIASLDELQGYDVILAACGVKGKIGDTPASAIDGLTIIGDGHYGKTTSVVECIADGQKAAEAILGQLTSVDTLIPADVNDVYSCRGLLEAAPETGCDGRCLHCDSVCEACVEVCPNRANVAIAVPGHMQAQILHVDYMCNECGNCRTFCPWGGAPYKDKFTLFANEEDLEHSDNQGFVVIDKVSGFCKVCLDGEIRSTTLGTADEAIPEDIRTFMETVCRDYGYLLIE